MKKTASNQRKVSAKQVAASRSRRRQGSDNEMQPHYDFDYSKSRPNRFASRFTNETVAVVLDPDVANVFRSSESVNTFLRSAITAMPSSESPKKKQTV
jgi:hypothetical protein